MRRRLLLLVATLLIAMTPLVMVFFQVSAARPVSEELGTKMAGTALDADLSPVARKVASELSATFYQAAPGEMLRFIIRLKAETDLKNQPLPDNLQERQAVVVGYLQQLAATSQTSVLERLESLHATGEIASYYPLWIINGVAATGSPGAIEQLATLPSVAEIRLDARHRYFQPPAEKINLEKLVQATMPMEASVSWGIERIGAPYVWDALEVDGQGVTVAIMDTGVDWHHPDLNANYRGKAGTGDINHKANWYNPVDPASTEPVDLIGHGTHVAGTTVGQNGIGVAPGALWIAVNIADPSGFIYESDVHKGFQWLLAPGGDVTQAPDIVNNSWGGDPFSTLFLSDVEVLHAAGIITVFAAGNEGPFESSIATPAGFPGTIAVGASDDIDAVVWFSSRGPSPLTTELKPWLVAPGTRILSSLPGGRYGLGTGTSMATPHVAGSIALLKSANPTLSADEIKQVLASSAVTLSSVHPNFDSGWGRLDIYGAVAGELSAGRIRGIVSGDGAPLPNAVITLTTSTGVDLVYRADGAGHYTAAIRPGTFGVTASGFGFAPATLRTISVAAGQTVSNAFDLSTLPGGIVSGTVLRAGTVSPLAAEIWIQDTPIRLHTDAGGHYSLSLPQGKYTIFAQVPGYRLGTAGISIESGKKLVQDFALANSPFILLVDSGQWYYDSYAEYFRTALLDTRYTYDFWSIRNPFEDVPELGDLRGYDFVVWSAPFDSPGYLGANDVITGYLGLGGNLLISGQDVGYRDGFGLGTQVWWQRDLEGVYLGKAESAQVVTGAPGGPFEGMSLTLNGTSSAGNQLVVDQSGRQLPSLTAPALLYPNGQAAGLQAGACEDFDIVYLGFGLEGVSDEADRAELLERSFSYFQTPPRQWGLNWETAPVSDFAVRGSRLVYTLTLQNLSEVTTDTVHLAVTNALWPSSLMTQTLTLGPCEKGRSILTLEVPDTLPIDYVHLTTVKASSSIANEAAEISLRHKASGHVLLIDDDRWYDRESVYRSALDAAGISYDYWEIGWDQEVRDSPTAELLSEYDFVIWYTGYDWFRPVTPQEREAITAFLRQGGRLFLSSQDFLYYHEETELARDLLGVIEYRESITPTILYADETLNLPNSLRSPLLLDFGDYHNFADGLVPAYTSKPIFYGDQGMATGVATADKWRTIFLAVPFEVLTPTAQAPVMASILGWLGDLGDSTFTVDEPVSLAGMTRTYTITLRNLDWGVSNKVYISNTLPAYLNIIPSSLTGGAAYDPSARRVTWQGTLTSSQNHVIRYQAIPDASANQGTLLENTVRIWYERHGINLDLSAPVWIDSPDLSASRLRADVDSPGPIQTVTYTLLLHNGGSAVADPVTATIRLPDDLALLTNTLAFGSGQASLTGHHLHWSGRLDAGQAVTVSIGMTREMAVQPMWLPAVAIIHNDTTGNLIRYAQPFLTPYQRRFPVVSRD